MGLGQNIGKRRAVDGCNDENLGALGHHVLDLRQLVRYVVFSILKIGLVAAFFQHLDHVVAIGNPACRRLRGHGDGDKTLVFRMRQTAKGKRGHRDCQC